MIRSLIAVLAGLMSSAACAEFVLRIGDTVYANGKTYTRAEWDKIKNDPNARAAAAANPPAPQSAPAPQTPPLVRSPEAVQAASVAPITKAAASLQSTAVRAATCRTTRAYVEFPAESEKFSCTGGLGSLTREEILRSGWKVDLIEKLPGSAEELAASRGQPLNYYKLVISR